MVLFIWRISLFFSCLFLWSLCFLHFVILTVFIFCWRNDMQFFGNLIIVFLPWSSFHSLLSVRSSSPLCWGISLAREIYVISCLLHVMAHYQRISSRPIADKWLLSGNGGCHVNRHNKKIPGQNMDITDNLLLGELCWLLYTCIECGSIKPQTQLLDLLHKCIIWCSPAIPA